MSNAFISYVSDNKEIIERIVSELETRGARIWLDRNDIEPGVPWASAIRNAIRKQNYFVACFSKASAVRRKSFMNEEILVAIEELRQHQPDAKFFIPVKIDECDIPPFDIGAGRTILDLQWICLYPNFSEAVNRIANAIIEPYKKK